MAAVRTDLVPVTATTSSSTSGTPPTSSLLESILFLMSQEQREQVLAAAEKNGVLYANKLPTFTQPLAVKLSRTANEFLRALVIDAMPCGPRGFYDRFRAAYWEAKKDRQHIDAVQFFHEAATLQEVMRSRQ